MSFHLAWWLALGAPVLASPPEAPTITIYREPADRSDPQSDSKWAGGFAFVTETRTVSLAAGENVIRFEDVAPGLVPESVVLNGLSGEVLERNLDWGLIAPGTLMDGHLGRRVFLRRTNPATGRVREQEADLLSGPFGVVLRTAEGIEALHCADWPETVRTAGLPARLSNRATLSVRVRAERAGTARLTLGYLASGFDWQAHYIARIEADGTLALSAWSTLINGNEQSFADAAVQAVAGRVTRVAPSGDVPDDPDLEITTLCWPRGSYADHRSSEEIELRQSNTAEQLLRELPGTLPVFARQEELGDLKLYRLPERVSLAAQARKQVALFQRQGIRFTPVFTGDVNHAIMGEAALALRLRLENKTSAGLGLPLPAGDMALFDGPALLAETFVSDTATSEEIEIFVGETSSVRLAQSAEHRRGGGRRIRLVLTNEKQEPIRAEIALEPAGGARIVRASERLMSRDGRPIWTTTVPAGGRRTFSYTLAAISPASRSAADAVPRPAPRR